MLIPTGKTETLNALLKSRLEAHPEFMNCGISALSMHHPCAFAYTNLALFVVSTVVIHAWYKHPKKNARYNNKFQQGPHG